MTTGSAAQSLDELADALGVTRSYHDGTGQYRRACDEAVLAALRALGAPVERMDDCGDTLRAVRERREASPVAVVAAGEAGRVRIDAAGARTAIRLEDGTEIAAEVSVEDGTARLPRDLPAGYHRIESTAGSTLLLVAPRTFPKAQKGWGLVAPLYSLRTGGDGLATYGDLARLARWMGEAAPRSAHERDAATLGTLPLLACFFEEPFEPSPYSPISRAFWSELYVDPAAPPEAEGARPAHRSPDVCDPRRIDYRRAMRSRRAGIEALLASLDRRGGRRRDEFERALEEDDELCRYAAFRACVEREGRTWQQWPARERDGKLRPGSDFDGEAYRYHAYAQWLAREQIAAAAEASDAGFFLDLPLGSHGGGYDTWRHAGQYAHGVSIGAPPDAVFAGGQDWGFPPMHPSRMRAAAYAGFRAALAHHFLHAAMLRVDHVMGFHRQFWIPEGFTAADGVYVRYPADEMWSVLAIEAARARGGRGAAVVGEDLGTVPDEVRAEMHERGALRMYVVPFEQQREPGRPLADPPAGSLACLGTHDMEPFAAWWDRPGTPRQGIASFTGAGGTEAAEALPALIGWLSASPAAVVCANLEDLWLERERQNLPGAEAADTNWKRRFARDFDDFTADPVVLSLVRRLRGERAAAHEVEAAP